MSGLVSFPRHTFTSPNGQGLCRYEVGGTTCGQAEQSWAHIKLITAHDYIPPTPGTIGEEDGGCFYGLQDGRPCGAQAASHARQAVPEFKQIDPVKRYLDAHASAAHETYHGAVFPVDSPPTTAQVVALFNDQALRLAVAKNAKYRDAWRRQGYMGNTSRILSKVERMRAMVWGDQTPDLATDTDETLRDTLLDLANLAAFAAANLQAGNRWGDEQR